MDAVETRIGMPLDRFLEESSRQHFELLNGDKVLLMPTVFFHSLLVKRIYDAILAYLREHPLGEVFAETTFILPNVAEPNWVKGSRIPDVMFIARDNLNEFLVSPLFAGDRPLALIPDLAIEIVSPTDNYRDVTEKAFLYLRDGLRVVWVFDYESKRVQVFSADGTTYYVSGEDTLTGGDVLPGVDMPLSSLFAA